MITLDMARRLHDAGVDWTPAAGDRFAVPGRDMDETVFVVSDMVVEVDDLATGRLIKFNGTTEWALDSLQQQETVWLPREDQLRELLGESFVSLAADGHGFVVTTRGAGVEHEHVAAPDAEGAYARAVLFELTGHRVGVAPNLPSP